MDHKIHGIVLQSIRYGDTSLIVRIFTRNEGLRSYMVKGAFNHGSKNRVALFQNLNLIQFVEVSRPNKGSLKYLKDVQLAHVFQSIPFVMNKSAILMYISELLSKTITEQEQNEALFDFIERSMLWLDLVDEHYANFPLFFTLELTRHLGFYPKANLQEGWCFDLMEGSFVHDFPVHPYYLDPEVASLLSQLLDLGIDETCQVPLRTSQRRDLLDKLIVFMRLHAPVMNDFHSHEVLKSVLE
ncbi:MAG: DNA repair protein RecO [Bacteroidales bacterium]|nr:DNA repair protein RecO [Bacteroidales bacterium]